MSTQIHPFSILLLVTALCSNVIVLTNMQKHRDKRSQVAVILMLSITLWMVGEAIEYFNTTQVAMLFWMQIQFIGICSASVIWLMYTVVHTNQISWLSPNRFLGISFFVLISLILVFTNEWHGLVFSQLSLQKLGSYVIGIYTSGIGFWLIVGYAILIDLTGVYVMFRAYIHSERKMFRWELFALMSAFSVPVGIFAFVDKFGLAPLFTVRLTPLAFGIAVPLVTALMNRLHIMELMPYARDVVLEHIEDAVIIVSNNNKILDLNKAANELFASNDRQMIGADIGALGYPLNSLFDNSQNHFGQPSEIQLSNGSTQKHFVIKNTPLLGWQGETLSNIIMFTDITEIKNRTVEVGTLLEAIKAISSNMDLSDALRLIAKQITILLNADSCTISYWDKENDVVVTWIDYTQTDVLLLDEPGMTYALVEFPATRFVLENKQALAVQISDSDADQTEVENMLSIGVISRLMLPLAIGDTVTGLVEIDHDVEAREFSLSDIRIAQALCDQAAIAIQNVNLLSETQRRLQEQSLLREAGMAISSALNLEVVLSRISEQMGQVIDATGVYVNTYDPTTKKSLVIAEYIGPEANDKERVSILGEEFPEDGHDEFLELMKAGLHDVTHFDDPDLTEYEQAEMQKYSGKSILYIPLRIKNQLIGYVELCETRQRRKFTSDEITLCHDLAQQAAIAFDNARLYEQAQQEIADRRWAEEELAKHRDHLEELVERRTKELKDRMREQKNILNLMAGREVRMADLKKVISKLRKQLKENDIVPVAHDPLIEPDEKWY
jgi:GAF domain-containing protein